MLILSVVSSGVLCVAPEATLLVSHHRSEVNRVEHGAEHHPVDAADVNQPFLNRPAEDREIRGHLSLLELPVLRDSAMGNPVLSMDAPFSTFS